VERAHGDRIMVTAESPEAFEEAVWMAFFEDAHDPTRNAVLDETTERGDFASFYRNHLRKLLLARGGSRYLAKGNYNVTRLAYLKRILPDALFVVPVRDPVAHIASLVRQHEHFCREGARNGRVRRHMRRSGHFEFGLDRRAIHTGDPESAERIRAHWEAGREVEGWAEYWASLYGHVHATLERRSDVREATLLVRYEDLCATPNAVVGEVLAHCGLTPHALPEAAAREVRAPDYYRMGFTDEETDTIVRRTASVARHFGYGEVAG
jgi:hypothetical protein